MTISNEIGALAQSLWTATAPEPTVGPVLGEDLSADICVIGGGISGLSTALHAAEAGQSVVLIEAETPGWGASGRNGGQVLPGLKENPREVVAHFGEIGKRMVAATGAAPDLVFDLIRRHGIDCGARQEGWVHAAAAHGLDGARDRAAQWRVLGVDIHDLSAAETREMLGGGQYAGALLDPRGGGVQPLAYSQGLAAAAAKAGVRIFAQTRAEALAQGSDGWIVTTPKGRVRAGQVVICTNGYSGPLDQRVKRNVIPIRSIQVATDPLPAEVTPDILPGGQVVSDTQKHLLYFRRDAGGRFVMGGAGAYTDAALERAFDRLKRHALELFPQLKGQAWRYRWGGNVAVTVDHLPHLAELAPGLHALIGLNGRGVAAATALGRVMATRLGGERPEALEYPVRDLKLIPFHRFHRHGVKMVMLWAALQDRLKIG